MDSADPPPKKYDLKPREFKRENTPGAAAPSAKDLAMISSQRAPVAPKPIAGPKPGDPNDVYVVLQQNRAVEQKAGLNEVQIRKKKSRRRRDYLLLMMLGNLLLALVAVLGRGNIVVLVSAAAGVIVFSIGVTWVMWFIMDDY